MSRSLKISVVSSHTTTMFAIVFTMAKIVVTGGASFNGSDKKWSSDGYILID